MKIKVSYWTGTVKEYVDSTLAQVIAIEYPEFATTNESEGGWLTYPYEDEGDYSFAQVYNRHGDLCCTLERNRPMKIKVSCKQHGDTIDTTGTPFLIATDHTRSTFEVDLSDMWCSLTEYNPATDEYEQCDLKMEVTES